MTEDARFEDGAERPLRLKAETAEDLGRMPASGTSRHFAATPQLGRFWSEADIRQDALIKLD
jgi:hypothetical protein